MRSVDTNPEMIVRRLVHRLGYRFRLHDKNLPGCPDLKLTRLKLVIFVFTVTYPAKAYLLTQKTNGAFSLLSSPNVRPHTIRLIEPN